MIQRSSYKEFEDVPYNAEKVIDLDFEQDVDENKKGIIIIVIFFTAKDWALSILTHKYDKEIFNSKKTHPFGEVLSN